MMRFFRNNRTQSKEHDRLAEAVKASGLFDAAWYLTHNPDVAAAGVDPLEHFVRVGMAEGRKLGLGIDEVWYLAENYELQAAGLNPVQHYVEKRGETFITPVPLHQGQKFESFNRSVRSGLLDGRTMFSEFKEVFFGTRLPGTAAASSTLPLPPVDLSLRIGSPTLEGFETIGREAKATIVRCLPPDFSFEGARCLDFGCGIGRAIRHFEKEAEVAEFWGCDIDGTSILWNNQNLSPPFRFFQLSDTPVIPLESSSFDLVYALGVFSQVFMDWQALAMEIRRILKPDGIFFMSFNGQTSFEEMFRKSYHESLKDTGMFVDHPFRAWNKGGPNVALSADWIETHWGSIFDIDYIAMEGFMEYQSFAILRKSQFGRRLPRSDVNVLTLGTSQEFNLNATGRLSPRFDASLPFRKSYGIVGSGLIQVDGWIVFQADRPERLEVKVDESVLQTTALFDANEANFRDWNAPLVSFAFPLDLAQLSKGLHRLTVTPQSTGGLRHSLSIPLTVN